MQLQRQLMIMIQPKIQSTYSYLTNIENLDAFTPAQAIKLIQYLLKILGGIFRYSPSLRTISPHPSTLDQNHTHPARDEPHTSTPCTLLPKTHLYDPVFQILFVYRRYCHCPHILRFALHSA
ncbi:hypothetical protein M378DRAFT_584204 [Amanita muscaria Koide BX008]|uniref:Uncharacterized protein n=1 Tax=Amanita muscaria (strain Koide BX008) TaxID=946122 RepID=A0A0C2W3D7_AMAMK|nr:hypothetical protein M378DRAFT_584204 [Amanita muscaria Koide BX008]